MNLPIEIILIIYNHSCWVTRLRIRMTCKTCNNFPLSFEKSWIQSFKESYNIYGIKYYQLKKFMYYHTEKNKTCDDRCCNDSCCIDLPYNLQKLTDEINRELYHNYPYVNKDKIEKIKNEIMKIIK